MSESISRSLICKVLIALLFASVAFVQTPSVSAASPSIILSSDRVTVGSILVVSGNNATQNSEVRLYLLGSLFLASTIANETGGYLVELTVPRLPAESYFLTAFDVATEETAMAFFAVEPKVRLGLTEGSFDDKIAVKGDGFAAFNDVAFHLNATDVTPSPQPRTDNFGSFESEFSVPSTPKGSYILNAYDLSGNVAQSSFKVSPELLLQPTSGGSSTFATVAGFGFAPLMRSTVYFDSIDVSLNLPITTASDGSFKMPFFVPDVPDGEYIISAHDAVGNTAIAPFIVPAPSLNVSPDWTSGSSFVTARGIGFQPYYPVVLYLEDTLATNLVDLMLLPQKLIPSTNGSFEYSFMVPAMKPGVYAVSAFQAFGSSPSDLTKVASDELTIYDDTSLNVEISVGSLHFNGEAAEFYIQTAFNGKLVDAQVESATLYYLNGSSSQELISSVAHVSTGIYRIAYTISKEAPPGTYLLVTTASYQTSLAQASGTTTGSFLLSPLLTVQNALLVGIDKSIGTIVLPDLATIKMNLSTINARLVGLEGDVATVQTDLGTLKTTADAIHAHVTGIDGDVATISSDIGTIEAQVADSPTSEMSMATMILALAVAMCSLMMALLIYKKRPPSAQASAPPKGTPPENSPAMVPTNPAKEKKQESPQNEDGVTISTVFGETPAESSPSMALAIPMENPVEKRQSNSTH